MKTRVKHRRCRRLGSQPWAIKSLMMDAPVAELIKHLNTQCFVFCFGYPRRDEKTVHFHHNSYSLLATALIVTLRAAFPRGLPAAIPVHDSKKESPRTSPRDASTISHLRLLTSRSLSWK